jgi:hypothetical protein
VNRLETMLFRESLSTTKKHSTPNQAGFNGPPYPDAHRLPWRLAEKGRGSGE